MPFAPGQSGNPNGRPPKDKALADMLRRELKRRGPDGRYHHIAIVTKLIALARDGSVEAMKLIFERVDGKVPQAMDLTTDGQPLAPLTVILREVADRHAGDS